LNIPSPADRLGLRALNVDELLPDTAIVIVDLERGVINRGTVLALPGEHQVQPGLKRQAVLLESPSGTQKHFHLSYMGLVPHDITGHMSRTNFTIRAEDASQLPATFQPIRRDGSDTSLPPQRWQED